MAIRRTAHTTPQSANLTIEQMIMGVSKLKRRISDLEAFDPQSVQKRWAPEVKALETSIEESLAAVFGHGTVEYNRYHGAARLDNGPVSVSFESSFIAARSGRSGQHFGTSPSTLEAHQYLAEGKQQAILLLKQAVRGLEEEIEDQSGIPLASAAAANPARSAADQPMTEIAIKEIRAALDEIKTQLPTITISNTIQSEIHSDIAQIETEIERPTPRKDLLKVFLESLCNSLGKATATGLVAIVGSLLARYFGVF